jgi:hypothetical protein
MDLEEYLKILEWIVVLLIELVEDPYLEELIRFVALLLLFFFLLLLMMN